MSRVGVGVLQSSLFQGFLLRLMLSVIHTQIRHPSRSSSSKRRLQRSCYCSRFSSSAITNHLFLAPYIATIGDSIQGSPLLLNKWESPSSHCEWFRLQGPCLAPGLGPSPQDRHRPSDASSDLALAVAFQGALSRTIRSWRRSCDYRRLRSRESPSPLQVGVAFKGFPLSIVNKANGIRLMEVPPIQGVPFSKWMRFTSRGSPSPQRMGFASGESPSPKRMGFASWGSPPIQGVPFSKWMRFTSRGFPSPQRMGFASRESPSPKRMGFASRGSPYPMRMRVASRGFLLSNANGIRFKGVPFSKANDIRFQGFPLSTATVFRFNEPYFISTSALVQCFFWG